MSCSALVRIASWCSDVLSYAISWECMAQVGTFGVMT